MISPTSLPLWAGAPIAHRHREGAAHYRLIFMPGSRLQGGGLEQRAWSARLPNTWPLCLAQYRLHFCLDKQLADKPPCHLPSHHIRACVAARLLPPPLRSRFLVSFPPFVSGFFFSFLCHPFFWAQASLLAFPRPLQPSLLFLRLSIG